MKFAEMAARSKMAIGFGMILILMTVICVFAALRMTTLEKIIYDVVEERFPKTEEANDIIDSVNVIARSLPMLYIIEPRERGAEIQQITTTRQQIDQQIELLQSHENSETGGALLQQVNALTATYGQQSDRYIALIQAGDLKAAGNLLLRDIRQTQRQYINAVLELVEYESEYMREGGQLAESLVYRGRIIVIWLASVAILLGIAAAYLITRSITGPLSRIVQGLNDGASQVSSSAGQVAGSGQELADGAAEQAASLEETSASLDEISSMTRQNADNAGMADTLMRETGGIVQKAANAMSELTTSMEQINSASTETQKIVKTIDEIAFQTNLLALNAAVEAARAGEAGAGFAVVADEVRNLAMRAAEAAKNTAALIDETVSRVGQGSSLVEQTNNTFSEVAASTKKAAGLVGEIAAASGEQAQGIGQLNQAMSEMDSVVQRTAANSEESAAAAEELSAMASQMMDYVSELLALVEGGSAAQATMSNQPHSRQLKRPVGAAPRRPAPQPVTPKKKTAALTAPAASTATKLQTQKKAEAAKAIPFDDDDFEDF